MTTQAGAVSEPPYRRLHAHAPTARRPRRAGRSARRHSGDRSDYYPLRVGRVISGTALRDSLTLRDGHAKAWACRLEGSWPTDRAGNGHGRPVLDAPPSVSAASG